MTRWHPLALLAAAVAAFSLGSAIAAPVSYTLPDETAAFKPGPNLEVVQNNCTACHSADYIQTQPHGPKFKKDFWQAEVTKMIKVYGAPIDEADVGKIVEYLADLLSITDLRFPSQLRSVHSPPPARPCAWWEGSGAGVSAHDAGSEYAELPPTPDPPTAARREGKNSELISMKKALRTGAPFSDRSLLPENPVTGRDAAVHLHP